MLKRIITCQGSIQLVAALSVMFHRDREVQHSSIDYQNYLVIYELYSSSNQHHEFAAFIQEMAKFVCDWCKIIYLDPDTINQFSKDLNSTPSQKIHAAIYDLVGIEIADEIYLSRNWQFTNSLLLNAYRSAQKICYGDGVGLYFSENSAVVRQPFASDQVQVSGLIDWLGWKVHGLEQRIRKTLNLKTILDPISFDIGYFVLPNIFDETPPMSTVQIEPNCLLNVFSRFTKLLDSDYVSHLKTLIRDSPVSILLTSNLSEAQRLAQNDEIFAYREFLMSQGVSSESVLFIKPHPRDDMNKIQALRSELSDLYREIIVLNQSQLFFLPFEILFLQVFWEVLSTVEVRVFAVSSACLSLKLLFDVPSFIGFGSQLTSSLFNPNYVEARLEHEQILLTALQKLDSEFIAKTSL